MLGALLAAGAEAPECTATRFIPSLDVLDAAQEPGRGESLRGLFQADARIAVYWATANPCGATRNLFSSSADTSRHFRAGGNPSCSVAVVSRLTWSALRAARSGQFRLAALVVIPAYAGIQRLSR